MVEDDGCEGDLGFRSGAILWWHGDWRFVIDDCVTPNVNNDVGINCHYLDGNRR